jgi:hypothetical protein
MFPGFNKKNVRRSSIDGDFDRDGVKNRKGYIPYTKVHGKQTFITPPGIDYFKTKEEASSWASKFIQSNLKKMAIKNRKSLGKIIIGVREINI